MDVYLLPFPRSGYVLDLNYQGTAKTAPHGDVLNHYKASITVKESQQEVKKQIPLSECK